MNHRGWRNVRSSSHAADLWDRAQKSAQQKIRQQNGETSEKLVEMEMLRRGDRLVEKVEVPFRIDPRTGHQFAKRKVSGDFRAIRPLAVPCLEEPIPGMAAGWSENVGISVLVEVKHHDERLAWSAFRPHQVLALDEHMTAGGITEVAWIDRGVLRFIPWSRFRAIGFGDRMSVVWTGTTIEIHTPARGKRETTTNTKAATA